MNKKYKEFDLKQALNGAKVETRDGRKVKYVHLINDTTNPRPLVGVVEDPSGGHDDIMNFDENGRFWDTKNESKLDLLIVEEVKTHYINVYKYDNGILMLSTFAYNSKQEAIENISEPKNSKYLKTIEVTDEVDEVVEEALDDVYVKHFNDFSDMMDYLIKNS